MNLKGVGTGIKPWGRVQDTSDLDCKELLKSEPVIVTLILA